MNILLFEDRTNSARIGEKILESEGHYVKHCRTCGDIIDAMDAGEKYDRYILDLNVSALGLKDTEAQKTEGGLLTGWVILIHRIYPKDENALEKAIIFSDYANDLRDYIDYPRANKNEKEYFALLDKRGAIIHKSEGYGKLLEVLASDIIKKGIESY
ncbi:MAG: hypothetical protein LBL82_04870 [Oscillospiraceae bacterium]|jgi:hypothetical protein|nr:hypothetical protein [Oscillospiraceae bacterium]